MKNKIMLSKKLLPLLLLLLLLCKKARFIGCNINTTTKNANSNNMRIP